MYVTINVPAMQDYTNKRDNLKGIRLSSQTQVHLVKS